MLRRLVFVAGLCAALLPFGGSASASCLDDYVADLFEGDTDAALSEHWGNWVQVQGLDVHVYTEDLVSDASALTFEVIADAPVAVNNSPGATLGFVDCTVG